jgi:hypothetical protein
LVEIAHRLNNTDAANDFIELFAAVCHHKAVSLHARVVDVLLLDGGGYNAAEPHAGYGNIHVGPRGRH